MLEGRDFRRKDKVVFGEVAKDQMGFIWLNLILIMWGQELDGPDRPCRDSVIFEFKILQLGFE